MGLRNWEVTYQYTVLYLNTTFHLHKYSYTQGYIVNQYASLEIRQNNKQIFPLMVRPVVTQQPNLTNVK